MLYRLEKVLVDRASTNIIQVAFSVNLKSAQSRLSRKKCRDGTS